MKLIEFLENSYLKDYELNTVLPQPGDTFEIKLKRVAGILGASKVEIQITQTWIEQ